MKLLEVVKYGHPVLRQKGVSIEKITPEIEALAAAMLETMHANKGIGLAAQQVGRALQLTVLDIRGVTDRPSILKLDGKETDADAIMPLVSSAVTTPRPAAHAAAVAVRPAGRIRVSWQAGNVYGSRYSVYWGPDADKVDQATELAHDGVAVTSVTDLVAQINVDHGRTYYWKVDTLAPGQSTPRVNGPLWRFTTAK